MSFGIIKVLQLNVACSSCVGILEVSIIRRNKLSVNTIATVAAGSCVSTLEVATGFAFVGDACETGLIMI